MPTTGTGGLGFELLLPTRVGGMVEFRRSLAASFLFRFFLLSSYKLAADSETFKPAFPETYKSAVKVRTATCLSKFSL